MNFEELLAEMWAMQGGEFGSLEMMLMWDPSLQQLMAWLWVWAIIGVALLILIVVARCFMFKKMGHHWYEALVSGHNTYVLVTKAGKPGWWVFAPALLAIPLIGWIVGGVLTILVYISVSIGLAKKFGRSTWFGVWLIFLPFIFYPILGFGKDTYQESLQEKVENMLDA